MSDRQQLNEMKKFLQIAENFIDEPVIEGDPLDAQNFGTKDEWAEEYAMRDTGTYYAGDCKTCAGTGSDNGTECDDCYGTGEMQELEESDSVCGVCKKEFVPVGNPDDDMCPSCVKDYLGEDEYDDDTEMDEHFSMKDPEVEEFEGRTVYITDLYDGDLYGMLDGNRFMVSAPLDRGEGVFNVTDEEIQIADFDHSLTSDDEDFLRRWYFDELSEGGAVKFDDYGITENKADDCGHCSGLGHDPSQANVECPECLGTGKASEIVIDEEADKECDRCHGLGRKPSGDGDCPDCGGSGLCPKLDEDEGEELPPIHAIANDIIRNWKKVNFGAVPYLEAMKTLSTKYDDYGADSGSSILAYGLSNMSSYSGRSVHDPELAKKHRAQLKQHLKEGIDLDSVVEGILQEYPGQPKDYYVPDDDPRVKDDYADKMNDIAGEDDAIGPPELGDFETDYIDPEIEDEELGLRFD